MQADEEVGKIAQAVPVIISRTLELFVESLLTKSSNITSSRNAKTLSPSHLKQCIISESRFDFLKDLVKMVPDIAMDEAAGSAPADDHGAVPSSSKSLFVILLVDLIVFGSFRQWNAGAQRPASRTTTKPVTPAFDSCRFRIEFESTISSATATKILFK